MNTAHPLRWQSPQPLWTRFGADAGAAAAAPEQARPALLRFAGDDFITFATAFFAALAARFAGFDSAILSAFAPATPPATAPTAAPTGPRSDPTAAPAATPPIVVIGLGASDSRGAAFES